MVFESKAFIKKMSLYKIFFGTKNKKTQPMKSVQRNWLSDEIRSRSDEIREGFLLQSPFEKLVIAEVWIENWSLKISR